MSTRTDTMQDYVAATKLCDSDNPWLRKVAEEVVREARTPEEKALTIFYHVRDAVRFSLAYSRSSASQTLKRGYGECGNKTNAQVALLRAVGIPARFRWVQARSDYLIAADGDDVKPTTACKHWRADGQPLHARSQTPRSPPVVQPSHLTDPVLSFGLR